MNTEKLYAEAIAKDYAPQQTSKIASLKKLDKKAKMPSTIFAYVFGIIMSLLLGVGMCLCMGKIGNNDILHLILGIIVGVVGILGASINYPIYKKLLEKGKQKYAFEIVELAKEICEENQ